MVLGLEGLIGLPELTRALEKLNTTVIKLTEQVTVVADDINGLTRELGIVKNIVGALKGVELEG